MNATISALVWCAIQVTVLTCGVAVVYLAARRVHPRAGAAAAGGGLLMVIALTVIIASPWPRWEFDHNAIQQAVVAPAANNASNADAHSSSTDTGSPVVEIAVQNRSYWTLFADAINRSTSGPSVESTAVEEQAVFRWPLVVAALLLGGALWAAVRLAWGVMSVGRLARSGRALDESRLSAIVQDLQSRLELDAQPAVREVDGLSTPATVEWRRPVVLLPTAWREWSEAELRAVMAHELAHIAARDYAVWFIARLAVVAHFYHPLVRWLAARLQLEQELAADMTAARLVGDSKAYLHSLASLALAMPPNRMTGPARTLFPSRSLLVRRVEMLRTNGVSRPQWQGARYATFAVVAIVGLAAAGLRGPGIDLAGRALAQVPAEKTADEPKAEASERISLEFVPPDALYAVSARVAQLAARDDVGPLIRSFAAGSTLKEQNLGVADISEFLFVPYGKLEGPHFVRVVVRFQSPEAKQHFRDWIGKAPGFEKASEPGVWRQGERGRFVEIDELTIVGDQFLKTIEKKEFAPLKNALPPWAAAWQSREKEPILAAAAVGTRLRSGLQEQMQKASRGPAAAFNSYMAPIWPLIMDVDWAIVGASLSDVIAIRATVQSNDEKNAANVRDTLKAFSKLLQNAISSNVLTMQPRPDGSQPLERYQPLIAELGDVLKNADFQATGKQVEVSMRSASSPATITKLLQSLLPSVEQARSAARAASSTNNLKQLAIAMLVHQDVSKKFPAAAGYSYKVGNEIRTSQYPHSWRIDMLQYIEQLPLYNRYHFDEPWDSEANKKVLAEMPAQFRSPFDPDQASTNTSYFVFTGKDTAFPEKDGTQLRQITDGTSKTLMLVEAKRPVPWTKPEDIAYAADQPVPKIEGWQPGEFLVALCDGSVHPVASDIDEATLRAFITKSGREPVRELPKPKATSP